MSEIIVYGAVWCADCKRSRDYLDAHAIPYTYIDIDASPEAAATVAEINRGYKILPTIVFPDGTVLAEPSNAELASRL